MRGVLELPKEFLPKGKQPKPCAYGIDLPRQFCDELRQIDPGLYPVFHKYQVMWDSIINLDEGELEEPRYTVNFEHGEVNMGFVLTDGKGHPLEDGSWHIWRWCYPHGLGHIVKLESRDPEYLEMVLTRLKLQADWTNKYGFRSYSKLLDACSEEEREILMKEKQYMMDCVHEENSWLMKKAMENYDRGIINPTNPQKETIFSAPGVANRTKTVRDLDDREGGLIIPESW